MRLPDSLVSLVDEGIIDKVLRPLMSGKEAQVFLVLSDGEERVAKIYKDAQHRTFRQRSEYTEGRGMRSSRDQRAIGKRTRYGRAQDEAAWRSAEVDTIYRLRAAGVRVPEPFHFIDGVLVMEMITAADGEPAPRLAEVGLSREEAQAVFDALLREVVKMLCAGVVHGDLSDYNVLMDPEGPVIIDFPQSVDAARNQNARKLLLRDVENLKRFLGRFCPNLRRMPYGEEMWDAYERNQLTPETALRGHYSRPSAKTDTASVLDAIQDAERDEARRREGLGLTPVRPRRREVVVAPAASSNRRDGNGPRRDQPRRDQPRRDQPRRDQPRRDQPRRDQPRRDQPLRDQPRRDQPGRDQPRRDQPGRDQPLRDQGPAAAPEGGGKRRRRRRRRGGAGGSPAGEGSAGVPKRDVARDRQAPRAAEDAPRAAEEAPRPAKRRRRRRRRGATAGPSSSS